MRRRSFLSLTALAAVGVPLVTACEDDPVATVTTPTPAASTRADGSVLVTLRYREHEVTAAFGPAVVTEDATLLRVEVVSATPLKGSTADPPQMGLPWAGPSLLAAGVGGIRLIDVDAATVSETIGAENNLLDTADLAGAAPSARPGSAAGSTVDAFCAFRALGDETSVDLVVPRVGLVAGVAVVAESDAPFTVKQALDRCGDLDASKGAPAEIASFTTSYDLSVSSQQEGREVTMTLGSDVLFDPDSATLGPDADATLQQVADQLTTYGGGDLTITGHTDDVADDAHNQALSEQRAQAVSDRLGELTDLSVYTVTVVGKGEAEPKVPNTDDASRALNRRVEISVTTGSPAALPDVSGEDATTPSASATPTRTPVGATPAASATSSTAAEQLPETTGPTASNKEVEVTWDTAGGSIVVGVPTVHRRGAYLEGVLTVRGGADGSGLPIGTWMSPDLLVNVRGELAPDLLLATSGIRLLGGGQRYFPVDYASNQDTGTYRPVTELQVDEILGAGEEVTLSVWWPDPGTDTVVVDYASTSAWIPEDALPAWRITDVPVTA